MPVPSNDTPVAVTSPVNAIVLPVCRAVAVAEFPVQLPLDPLASPVTLPVKLPENVPDKTSVFELNVKPLALFGAKFPLAAVTNNGKQVVSVLSSTMVTVLAIAAVPLVSWFPDVFTPGRLILAVPSKLTPPIVLAVCKAVAVAAFPVVDPEDPETLPVTLPVRLPVTFPVTLPVIFPTNPLVAVTVLDDVNLVAVKSGMLAAMFSNVTEKLELDCTIGNNAPLTGVVVVAKSDIFFVAIYCIVHVVVETGVNSCQSSVFITVAVSNFIKSPSSVANTDRLSSVSI